MSQYTEAQALHLRRWAALVQITDLLVGPEGQRYRLRQGAAWRSEAANEADGGHPRSLHRDRLANDSEIDELNPMTGDWSRITASMEGRRVLDRLHDIWDLLGGAERIDDDLNHFSTAWGGMR
jgi:hypothetical protein